MKRAIAVAFLALISGGSAGAEELLAGLPADEYWRHQREFAELMPKAIAGDPVAQDRIGAFYDYGFMSGNSSLAALWYRKAARQGNADAEYNLANLYLRGYGVAEDHEEAIRLIKAAAAQKHPLAEAWLGRAYLSGGCVGCYLAEDEQRGKMLVRNAADAGVPDAIGLWAELLPDKDPQKSAWMKKAAQAGSEEILANWDYARWVGMSVPAFMRIGVEHGLASLPAIYSCAIPQIEPLEQVRVEVLHWLGNGFDVNDAASVYALKLLYDSGALVSDSNNRHLLEVLIQEHDLYAPAEDTTRKVKRLLDALAPGTRKEIQHRRWLLRQRQMLFTDLNVRPAMGIHPGMSTPVVQWLTVCQMLDGL